MGATLEQVCLGEHQLQLRFEGDLRLAVESTFRLERDGSVDVFEAVIPGASEVARLLSQRVKSAARVGAGTLRLEFDSGTSIEIFDDSVQFESYQIHYGDGEIIVV